VKGIGYILRTYFHLRPFVLGTMVLAACLLLIANFMVHNHERIAWCFFLYSLTAAAIMTGFHLRQALETSTADMLPHHRSRQLVTAGLILTVILIWPVLLVVLRGGPVLVTLAVFLLFACSGLASSFFSTRASGASLILGIPVIYWLLYDVSRLAGAFPGTSTIAGLELYASPFWPAYVIIASVLGLISFGIFFLKTSYSSFSDELNADYLQCLATQDWVGPLAVRRAEAAIVLLSRKYRDRPLSKFQLARLFQFSLFSPVYAARFYGVPIFLICLLFTYLSYQKSSSHGPTMNFFLPFAYFYLTAVLAVDFLSHKDRLPSIYLQSDLPSRKTFALTTVISYLLVTGKQMLGITLATTVIHLIFSWTTWTNFVPLCFIGLLLSLIQISISLLAGRWMKPSYGIAYILVNALAAIVITLFSRLYSSSWGIIAAMALLTGMLFWFAVRRWMGSGMEFVTN
jgi:hypothetical protein